CATTSLPRPERSVAKSIKSQGLRARARVRTAFQRARSFGPGSALQQTAKAPRNVIPRAVFRPRVGIGEKQILRYARNDTRRFLSNTLGVVACARLPMWPSFHTTRLS